MWYKKCFYKFFVFVNCHIDLSHNFFLSVRLYFHPSHFMSKTMVSSDNENPLEKKPIEHFTDGRDSWEIDITNLKGKLNREKIALNEDEVFSNKYRESIATTFIGIVVAFIFLTGAPWWLNSDLGELNINYKLNRVIFFVFISSILIVTLIIACLVGYYQYTTKKRKKEKKKN